MNHATDERPLTTADLAAATDPAQRTRAAQQQDLRDSARSIDDNAASALRDDGQQLAPLFVPQAAEDFRARWDAIQIGFVDNPKGVLFEADQLVRELMHKRGYPMADFAERAADISVDHPTVVQHYRAAQAIAMRDQRGEADTEELRKGVVHYRALFQDLLEVSGDLRAPSTHRHAEVHS